MAAAAQVGLLALLLGCVIAGIIRDHRRYR